jgi:hypothetical protein
VQSHDGQARVRRRRHPRDARREAGRRVDDDVRELEPLEQGERARAQAVGEPVAVAELHGADHPRRVERREPRARLGQRRRGGARGAEVARPLQEDRAELPGGDERRERVEEERPRRLARRRRHVGAGHAVRPASDGGSSSRSARGSRRGSTGCPVSRACALTSNTKPGGVRAAHSSATRRVGST